MFVVPAPRRRPVLAVLALAALVAAPASGAVDSSGAAMVFAEAKAICTRDDGALWGRSLCGPIVLVDPSDRAVLANQADAGGALRPSGSQFAGVLPPEVIVANTPTEWSGTRWTQMMWPLPTDAAKRHVLIAHEMFHRIQPGLGLTRPEGGNGHLDTLQGRYLLQLEWRALARALHAPFAAGRRAGTTDALAFRRERYRRFPEAAAQEAALEINEGVAEYTGVMLGLSTPSERIDFAVYDLGAFVSAPSFVRSFAYATGPAYGLLLDEAAPGWRRRLSSGQRLDEVLAAALPMQGRTTALTAAALKVRAAAYDGAVLWQAELKREKLRRVRVAQLKARLVDGPVLRLPLPHVSYQFNPQTLQPLDGYGAVYPTMRLSSDWGTLEVEDGALLDKDMTVAAVSAAGRTSTDLVGNGWRLNLKPGWIVKPGPRKGDLVVAPSKADR